MKRALLLVLLAACEHPGARVTYAVSDDPATSCGTTKCRDIELPCDAVVSIRIVDPDDPMMTLHPVCEVLPRNRDMTLCALSSVELAAESFELPAKTLDFQLVIWPRSEVETETGELDCAKHDVRFDAVYGFPVSQDPVPAIGGHAYYHPGDEEVRIDLGCPNLDSLRNCNPSREVEFRTSVRNFNNIDLFVSRAQGMQLGLQLGEPELRGNDSAYSLRTEDLTPMALDDASPFAAGWIAKFAPDFIDIACVQVLEQVAQSTASVKCTDDNIPTEQASLNLPDGVLLPKATLDQILVALGRTAFPANGMTVGIVVDKDYVPLAGQTVQVQNGNAAIKYLSESRTDFTATATTSNGIWVSELAEFRTRFSIPGAAEEIGGRIQDKVTIVVIRKP